MTLMKNHKSKLVKRAAKARRGLVDSKKVCEINNLKVSKLSGSLTVTICLLTSYRILFLFLAESYSMHRFNTQQGIEPVPPAEEVQSLNHWTCQESPPSIFENRESAFFVLTNRCLPVTGINSFLLLWLGRAPTAHLACYSQCMTDLGLPSSEFSKHLCDGSSLNSS